MADALEHPDQATNDDLLAAVELDNQRHMEQATLPDGTVVVDETEARQLVASFRRVRDTQRGRYAASVSELPSDALRVANALGVLGQAATPEERRHLLEDLVDLQAFVPDPPASLRPTPTPDPLLESIRWRQAALMAYAMGHASVMGDHTAIRDRWTAIGDARAAINLVNLYRETQAGGFAALTAWPIGALVGFGLAIITGSARPSIAALVVLGIGWLAAPYLGAAVGMFEVRVERSAIRRSHPTLIDRLELVVGLGAIALAPAVVGIVVTILATRLGVP
jgi:hypothetical protein